MEGNFTCIANDGASVVDYNIASSKLFSKISYFNIEDRDQSVHFPVKCQFTFLCAKQDPLIHLGDKPEYFLTQNNVLRWNETLKEILLTLFREKLTSLKQDITQQVNNSINTAITLVTNVYTSAATCMSKPSKTHF